MNAPPKILDLYCGGGGAGYGYYLAGFEVTGIDIIKRRCGYPAGEFVQSSVPIILKYYPEFLTKFDLIHASPPCQNSTIAKHLREAQGKVERATDHIELTQRVLRESGIPYVIENVVGAPIRNDLLLCGSMFDLHVTDESGRRWLKRHRIFETSFPVTQPPCNHDATRPLGVYYKKGDNIPGGGQTARTLEEGQQLMGIDWMGWKPLTEAIPPSYTHYIATNFKEQRCLTD